MKRLFVDIPFLQKTLNESKKALVPLQEERNRLEKKITVFDPIALAKRFN